MFAITVSVADGGNRNTSLNLLIGCKLYAVYAELEASAVICELDNYSLYVGCPTPVLQECLFIHSFIHSFL